MSDGKVKISGVPAPRSSPSLGLSSSEGEPVSGIHAIATHGWVRHVANVKMVAAIIGGAVLGLLGTGATFNSWVVTSASSTAQRQFEPLDDKVETLRHDFDEHKKDEAELHRQVTGELSANRAESRADNHALYQAVMTRQRQRRLEVLTSDGGIP